MSRLEKMRAPEDFGESDFHFALNMRNEVLIVRGDVSLNIGDIDKACDKMVQFIRITSQHERLARLEEHEHAR